MARLRKINGSYYSYWYDRDRSPKEKSYPLRCSRQDVARRRLRKLEEGHASGRFDPWKGGWLHEQLSCTEAVRRFLKHKEGSVRDRTLGTYRQQLEAWTGTLPAGLHLRDAEPKHLRRYILASGISTASKRKRFRHLKVFLRWAEQEGLLEENPLEEIRPPKRERKAPEFLTPLSLNAFS